MLSERERGNEKERISLLPVHSPTSHNHPGQTKSKPGTENPISTSHVGVWGSRILVILYYLPGLHEEEAGIWECIWDLTKSTGIWDAGLPSSSLTLCTVKRASAFLPPWTQQLHLEFIPIKTQDARNIHKIIFYNIICENV